MDDSPGHPDPVALGLQFDLLVDAGRDYAILSLSPDGFVTSWNLGAERIKGYTAAEIVGRHFSVFYTPEDVASGKLEREMQIAVRTGSFEGEGWRVRKDGSRFWANVVTTAIFDEGKGELIGFGKVTRDMTERKRFVDELQAAHDVSERAEHAKDQFLANMSHELRTPLNAVLGFSQVLQLDDLSPGQRECVDYIADAGQHLLGLINDILDISRVISGHLSIHTGPVGVAGVVHQALHLVQNLARDRGVTITVDSGDDLCVTADPQRLRQVVLNLLSNAVKYNEPDGTVQVSWSTEENGRVRLGVTDTGPGIAADQLTRLFVPFDRLDADSTETEGSGLGLALSKALVEAMNGRIDVTSEPGHGSTFALDLPSADEAEPDNGERTEAPLTADRDAPLRVLYVEDNLANLQLVQHVLHSRPNVELVPAMQARAGIALAGTIAPDLVLLDLNLPDLTGEEAILELRSNADLADLPVAVLTADADPGRVATLRELGVRDYLTKPIDVAALLDLVDRSPRVPAVP